MKKLYDKYKVILILIIFLAILIRLIFISKTDISNYQYDVGIDDLNSAEDYNNLYKNFGEGNNEGRHINYIMQLYTYNELPNRVIGQFYHPPLHHFIMSTCLKILDIFSENSVFKFESLQFVTFIYSIIILIALYKILGELNFNNKNKIIAMLLFSFYPIFIWETGSINNDELVIMFSILVLLYLLRWEKEQSYLNTVKIALCIGLGFMTKTSMVVMVVPTVYIYFKVLNKYIKEDKNVNKLIIQLLIFSLISVPLALWYQLNRMYNGLNTMCIIMPKEELYIGDKGFWNRWGIINPFVVDGINLWNYLIYTSLNFGFIFSNNTIFYIMAILAIILIFDFIYYFIKEFKENIVLNIIIISYLISYLMLNIKMPYTCSMHSRYMVVPISLAFIIIAKGLIKENKKWMKYQVYFVTGCSIILSALVFCIL